MSLENLQVEDKVRIVAAGGGMKLDASKLTPDELISVASAAGVSRARIAIAHSDVLSVEQLVLIAASGKGTVFFQP